MLEILSTGILIGAGVWSIASLTGYGIYFLFHLVNRNS